MALYRASLSGGFGNPSSLRAPSRRVGAAAIARGRAVLPLVKIGVPASDVTGGNEVVFRALALSAMRPPQPDALALVDTEVCHWFCWSEWENRFRGSRADPPI